MTARPGGGVASGIAQAGRTLVGAPLRTALAALAMAVAVATTAAVQTSLDGLARSARAASARAFGSDSFALVRLSTGTLSRREVAERLQRNPPITRGDGRFLEGVAAGRVTYAASAQRAADVSATGRTLERATVNGTQATLPDIREVGMARGRFLSLDEEVAGSAVVVVGQAVVDELFPGVDPLGREVRIAGRGFRVIGTLLSQGSASGSSQDRFVWMPLRAFERAFGAPDSVQVFAVADGATSTAEAEDLARISLRARRHLGPGAPDTFDIITPEASRSFVARITEQVSAAGPPIAFIALVAAIVVVTNTTLVSVTQRTREIGIRRALGATRRDITIETLAESTLVALVGGALGLTLAAGLVRLASGPIGLPLALNLGVSLASLAAAGGAGLVAGWYPARRATRLDVVDAMRQE